MIQKLNEKFAHNKQVNFLKSPEGFIMMDIDNPMAKARISLYGGQLFDFQPHSQSEPVFWQSKKAVYKQGKGIRGGVPICWPWFGAIKSGDKSTGNEIKLPAHGFARISNWKVKSVTTLKDETTEVVLKLPCEAVCEQYQNLQSDFEARLSLRLVIGEQLSMELITKNTGKYPVRISEALHSYFKIADIHDVVIKGLDNTDYIDKLLNNHVFRQGGDLILEAETDRIYVDTSSSVAIVDKQLNRTIEISKTGSMSTIIWNPWEQNSKAMVDMPDKGWQSMVCVEVANTADNEVLVQPGETHQMMMQIEIRQEA